MRKAFALFLCFCFYHCLLSAQNKKQSLQDKLTAFDAYVKKGMQTWRVPGIALAIVKDNEVVFTKGYGSREIGTDKKVDTKTYFTCASTTKAMTAVCMGTLVDQGKIKWSDKVSMYLPDFKLYDPLVTNDLMIQDLFTHNTGVGNADYLWVDNDLTQDEILYKMRLVKPSYSLRSSFIYQNIFYLVAGKIIEKISGKTWDAYIKENIFDKLGMNRTKALYKYVINDENKAVPHDIVDKQLTVIQKESADAIGPAGSVSSCADDIALWVKCMIDSSRYNGGYLVRPETWEYLTKPKTLVPEDEYYPTQILTKPGFTTYAMGWFQQDYKGHKLNFHTGSLAGETAIHAQLPDKKFGIYIFGNLDHAELRHALMFKALDLFELGGDTDWSTAFKNLYDSIRGQARKADSANLPVQVMNTTPSLSLNEYAGLYSDELYGNIEIKLENNTLELLMNHSLKGELVHFHFNTFKASYAKKQYTPDYYTFQLNNRGKVDAILVNGVTFKKEIK